VSRGIEKLRALTIDKLAKQPGMHHDGGGLYLRVTSPTARSWIYRYMMDQRAREMGLGPYPQITLAEARQTAAEARRLKARRLDPLAVRKDKEAEARLEAAKSVSFKEAAEQYIKSHEKGWKNSKHKAQWSSTLKRHVYPVFDSIPVAAVDTGLVMKALEPIWSSKPETASRVRGRIENILDWAKARGYRQGENPARWKGHLDHLLPAKGKVAKVQHHPALPYPELPHFMSGLRKREELSARALEFMILTASRTGEVIGATWHEIDLKNALWSIPASRTKTGKEHRVPLSSPAIELLEALPRLNSNIHLFPGLGCKPLSNMAMLTLLRRIEREDLTVHGFRSTFRDWAAERTDYPNEVAEMALGHAVSSKVEAAYRRGDLYEKRRAIMNDWAQYCVSQ
jgi:integrase